MCFINHFLGWSKYVHAFNWITFVNYRAQKLNKYSLTRKYLLQKQNIIKRSATCIIIVWVFFGRVELLSDFLTSQFNN
jgi:hypothetical protein